MPRRSQRKTHNTALVAAAARIWRASRPAAGTLVETYLRSRKITVTPPAALRFHPHLRHRSGGLWPAMVALVTRGLDGAPVAIHRTFLERNGVGKVPVAPDKMMLGSCRGAARSPGGRRNRIDGRRGDRNLPCRDAGNGPSRLGSVVDFWTAGARTAQKTCAR